MIVRKKVHMFEKSNKHITSLYFEVLSLFTDTYELELHIREVGRRLGISVSSAKLILEYFEKLGILISQSRGKTKLYSINKSYFSREYFVFVEQFKRLIFFQKNVLVKEICEKIYDYVDGVGVIFGSFSKGLEKSDSDLDIFVMGKYDKAKIKAVSSIYGIVVSIKNYPFEYDNTDDFLFKEVISSHIIFKGTEFFVDKVGKWKK